ncbi:hypothetical protein FRB99_001689 [Tulasnella sp. 403]|nr:hypothetical protein FRB99_001689 [Tulasnella sp. 403]
MTHATLSSPTETHAAASGIIPRSQHAIPGGSSPNWNDDQSNPAGVFSGNGHNRNQSASLSFSDLEETMEFANPDRDSDETGREPIEIDPTFEKNAQWPGTVKVVVEATTFWAHKEVLVFASPFFEAVLKGCWAESGRPSSISSVITISQPPSIPGASSSGSIPSPTLPLTLDSIIQESVQLASASALPVSAEDPSEDTIGPGVDSFNNTDVMVASSMGETSSGQEDEPPSPMAPLSLGLQGEERFNDPVTTDMSSNATAYSENRERERLGSLNKLLGERTSPKTENFSNLLHFQQLTPRVKPWQKSQRPVATIHLKEERAPIFHDFLKFVYPHLDCTITWYNVEGLMNLSHKLVVPSLQNKCLTFLLTHAAGKPIKAMRIAELFEEEELYREASRFVLDNPGGWPDWELNTLSHTTLWKLEKRRTWFLERVLKLGLVNIAKEYQCCASCPDPPGCAKSLEEKWRQNYHALFRFGPVQPSMVYRYLRSLEGVSPPLHLLQLSCQMCAKNWIASLFDRMFSLGVHVTPLSGRGVVASPGANGPRRHFLYCTLKEEPEKKKAKPREGNTANQRATLPGTRSVA